MTESEHIQGAIERFVLPRYRERLRLKPEEFLDDLYHALPSKLDRSVVIQVAPAARKMVYRIISDLSPRQTGWFLGGFGDSAEYRLDVAIAKLEQETGAMVSVEPGEIAYYRPELDRGPKGWASAAYLLISNADRRHIASQSLK
jgi:hypothetical protein